MGLNVHKTLGYGFCDVETSEDEKGRVYIDDDRLNNEFIKECKLYQIDIDEFIEWLVSDECVKQVMKNLDSSAWITPDIQWLSAELSIARSNLQAMREDKRGMNRLHDLGNMIHYNAEFGMPNVITFVPPTEMKCWCRMDDPIDHVEETFCRGSFDNAQANHVKVLAHGEDNDYRGTSGLFPWKGMIRFDDPDEELHDIDGRTPETLRNCGYLSARDYSAALGTFSKNMKEPHPAVKRDLLNNWRIALPTQLIAGFIYTDVFQDVENTLRLLKPMIYTYWL